MRLPWPRATYPVQTLKAKLVFRPIHMIPAKFEFHRPGREGAIHDRSPQRCGTERNSRLQRL